MYLEFFDGIIYDCEEGAEHYMRIFKICEV